MILIERFRKAMARRGYFLLGWVMMLVAKYPTGLTLIAAASAKKNSVHTFG
jgi:hypothetical protein